METNNGTTSPRPIIGVVGCGQIAETHIEAIRAARPDAAIVVCDAAPGKAELLRRSHQLLAAYSSIKAMLAAVRPLAVHILTPPQYHVANALECLAAGCHVLVEKPLCLAPEEAERLYQAADACGRVVCVDHSLLYQPSVRRMLAQLGSDPAGQVTQVCSYYSLDADGPGAGVADMPEWKRRLAGGALMDTLVHPVTLAVELTGRPERIHVNRVRRTGHVEELAVSWEGANALVSLTVSLGGRPFRRVTEVVSVQGTFTIDHSTEVLVHSGLGIGPKAAKKLARNLGYAWQLLRGTAATVWQVARGRIKQNPGARALVEAFYRQLETAGADPVSRQNVRWSVEVLAAVVAVLDADQPPRPAMPARTEVEAPREKVLVTGASGFLGRAVCRELIEAGGRQVVALARRGPNADRLPASPRLDLRFVDLDGMAPSDYRELLQGVTAVVHCAHASRARTWDDYRRRNVDVSVALYEAAAAAGCQRFIHLSSVSVYGVKNVRPNLLAEDAETRAGKGGWDFYSRSKADADVELQRRALAGGPALLILRPGILYAASGERLIGRSIPWGASRLVIELGAGRNRLPYTRVDVLAATIRRLLDRPELPTGCFNVTGRMNEPYAQFKQQRLEALGIAHRVVRVPGWPLRLGALMLEGLWTLARRPVPPPLNCYIVDAASRDLVYDSSAARRAFDWDPDAAVAIADHHAPARCRTPEARAVRPDLLDELRPA